MNRVLGHFCPHTGWIGSSINILNCSILPLRDLCIDLKMKVMNFVLKKIGQFIHHLRKLNL